METPYLAFQLYSPLAAWGEQAVGETRRSSTHPGKSSIVGIVGAALGLKRDEEELLQQLDRHVGLGVKVFSSGDALRDYHTSQAPKPRRKGKYMTRKDELDVPEDRISTILSSREYRMESGWVVALWSRSDSEAFRLEKIGEALRRPAFCLYLGRKSCPPALPLNPILQSSASLKEALDEYPEGMPLTDTARNSTRYFWEGSPQPNGGMVPGMAWDQIVPRYDHCGNRRQWQFRPREEFMSFGERKAG